MIRIWKIQRIGLARAFRTGFIVCGILGLIFGVFIAAGLIMFSALIMAALKIGAGEIGIVMAVVLPVVFSVVFAATGGSTCFLAALAYNFTAGLFGGLEIEMEEKKPESYNDIYGDFVE